MPNHVKTVVKFKNLKSKEDVEFILNMIATPSLHDADGNPLDYMIDFNKIIPEPACEEECPKDYIITEDSHVMTYSDRPWFDWYRWHLDNWGTKWNAYDGYTRIGKSYIKFVFSTAWSLAYPVMQRLSLLGYDIDICYADEDLGVNCGKLNYSTKGGWTHYDESELHNPYDFARRLWNNY